MPLSVTLSGLTNSLEIYGDVCAKMQLRSVPVTFITHDELLC